MISFGTKPSIADIQTYRPLSIQAIGHSGRVLTSTAAFHEALHHPHPELWRAKRLVLINHGVCPYPICEATMAAIKPQRAYGGDASHQ